MKVVLWVVSSVAFFTGCQGVVTGQEMVQGSPYIYNDSQYERRIVLRVAGNREVLFDESILGQNTVPVFIQPETLGCREALEVAVVMPYTAAMEQSFQRISGDLCRITEHDPKVLIITDSRRQAHFEVVPVDYE